MSAEIIKSLLKPEDKVGLITPAGFITEEKLHNAINNLASIGLKPVFHKNILEKKGYLAGSDERRLNELHSMYKDENIKAIWCVRGGYGTTRVLDKISYNLIKQNPKPLLGYSDITALNQAIYKKTGIPGFQAVVASGNFTPYVVENLKNCLFSNSENIKINIFEEHKEDAYIITEGNMSGTLAGGNLALIVSLLGTPFDMAWDNKIIFLEDVSEAPYRIDRMLTQLISSGKFNRVKGIILGKFNDCEPDEDDKINSMSLKEVIIDRLKPLNIPAVYGFSFGHIKNRAIIPVGINANFNTENLSLSIKRKEINRFFV